MSKKPAKILGYDAWNAKTGSLPSEAISESEFDGVRVELITADDDAILGVYRHDTNEGVLDSESVMGLEDFFKYHWEV